VTPTEVDDEVARPVDRLLRHLPTLVATVPLVVAAARALSNGWYPIGDNAFFPLRARDVLTEHHPLLGTWTSASLSVGVDINNPGPLLFDILALPAKIDIAAGTVIAVVAMHLASVVLGVHWGRRVAGIGGAWAAALAFLGLAWAMGSELLVEPWQPHSLLFPFLTFLVLVWALAAGHPWAAPWAAGVASVVLQTHLSYAVLVPALALLGVGVLLGLGVRATGWEVTRRQVARPALASLVVLAVAWSQPLVDQVAGEGNLTAVLANGGSGDVVAGPGFALSVLATVLAVPGGWGRGGFATIAPVSDAQDPSRSLELVGAADATTAVLWGLVVLAIFGGAAWLAWRDRDRRWGAALLVATTAIAATFVSIALLPVSDIFGLGAHQLRPMWPVSVFGLAAGLGALVTRTRRAVPILAVAAAALLALSLPAHNAASGPAADAWAIPVVRDLAIQMDALDLDGLVLVDLSTIRFAEPYSTPVMLELQRRGIEFVVDDNTARQLGEGRRLAPVDEVTVVLRIVEGQAAIAPAPGWERVAFVAGLDPDEEVEWTTLARDPERDPARLAELERRRSFESVAVLVRPVP
jgi:hypothetical protein